MRLLIDINVLLDVAVQRPGAPASARLLALCGRQHEAWLATTLNMPTTTFNAMSKYITGRTQLYRVQSIGYFGNGGPTARVEAVIDTNQGKPRIVYFRDLTELGRGFEPPR